MSSLNNTLYEWFKYDKYIEEKERELQKMRDEINNLREQKNKLENGIVKYIDKNNMTDNVFKINDYKIEYKISNKSVNVNKGHIYKCLTKYFRGNMKMVNELMNMIYNDREKIQKSYLKRSDYKNRKNIKNNNNKNKYSR